LLSLIVPAARGHTGYAVEHGDDGVLSWPCALLLRSVWLPAQRGRKRRRSACCNPDQSLRPVAHRSVCAAVAGRQT